MRLPGLLSLLLAAALPLAGCYYTRLAQGQLDVLNRREPIAKIIVDENRDAELRSRLQRVLDARRYAVERLALPDNASYQFYSDLGRPYVVWNLFATPELSLEPVTHCFLLVGCLAYRGYYEEAQAGKAAETLRAQGYDVHVGGVAAYSTLGWFNDPVMNTMLRWDESQLIGTIFHELAHQKLFVRSDTAFNESFASFVEREGLRQYRAARALEDPHDELRQARAAQFTQLILAARERLKQLYASDVPDADKRSGKQAGFARLRADYQQLRDGEWAGYSGYDGWFSEDLNNARLLPFGLYDEWVPAFAALFERSGGDWPAFYAAVTALSRLPAAARGEQLEQLRDEGAEATATSRPGPAGP